MEVLASTCIARAGCLNSNAAHLAVSSLWLTGWSLTRCSRTTVFRGFAVFCCGKPVSAVWVRLGGYDVNAAAWHVFQGRLCCLLMEERQVPPDRGNFSHVSQSCCYSGDLISMFYHSPPGSQLVLWCFTCSVPKEPSSVWNKPMATKAVIALLRGKRIFFALAIVLLPLWLALKVPNLCSALWRKSLWVILMIRVSHKTHT